MRVILFPFRSILRFIRLFSTHLGSKKKAKRTLKVITSFAHKEAKSARRTFAQDIKDVSRVLKRSLRTAILFVPRRWRYFFLGGMTTILFVFLPYQGYTFLQSLPNPRLLANRSVPVTTKIFDRHGQLLYEIYTDQNRTPLPLAEIPIVVKQATIATEDQDFYNHPGFSIRGILRAAYESFVNRNLQGGSTITQQLIKSALLTPETTLNRKVKEVILAFWGERLFSKDQILEMYLNQVPYGGTAWGVESASQAYFGKSIRDVNLAEAALLVGLPAAPTIYSPFGQYPELAKIRQAEVLDRMTEVGFITREQAAQAKRAPLAFTRPNVPIKAPHFVMYVRNVLEKRYGLRAVEQGGLRVTTTLDLNTQDMAQEIVSSEVDKLAPLLVGNGAALVVDPKTGEILAMVGGKNYFDTTNAGNVNVTLALRQPGSSIKVVNYAAALEDGFTATSMLNDSPVTYQSVGGSYTPVNYDGRSHGMVSLRSALANSYNIPAVKVLARLGVQTMVDKGRKMGITSWSNPDRFGLALTLGSGEVTMLDMMSVYATMANDGKRPEINPLLSVTNYRGEELETNRIRVQEQAIRPEVAFILSDILADNAARTPAFGPSSALVVPGKTISAKTGTSNDKRDNLTYGYTPSYVVGVWVGNNDNRPMHPTLTSGVTGAAPIWNQIMTHLLAQKQDEKFPVPEGVVTIPCHGRVEYFIRGTEPAHGCPRLPTILPPSSQTPKPPTTTRR